MHRHERPSENLNAAEARRGMRKVKETKIDIEEKRRKERKENEDERAAHFRNNKNYKK